MLQFNSRLGILKGFSLTPYINANERPVLITPPPVLGQSLERSEQLMSDYTPKKCCSKCGVEKPATSEYFYKASTCKDGLNTICKTCVIAYQNEYLKLPHVRAKEQIRRSSPEYLAKQRIRSNKPEQRARDNKRKKSPEARAKRTEQRRMTAREHRSGFVYLFSSENGLYKIGRAVNPSRRFRQLWTLSPIDVYSVCTIATSDMYETECQLHRRFLDKRVKGEWYRLNSEDVKFILDFAAKEVCSSQTSGANYVHQSLKRSE